MEQYVENYHHKSMNWTWLMQWMWLEFVNLQTFAMVHNFALIFFMGDYPASG
jgi:hypothetical protein